MIPSNSSTQPDKTTHSVEARATFRRHALEDYRVARKFLSFARSQKREGNYTWADIYQENAQLHLQSARSWRRVLNTLKPKRS